MLISARLGEGMMARGYVLRRPSDERPGWWRRLFSNGRPAFSFTIPDRDEAGSKALADLRARGINAVANAMAQSTDHILSFFQLLRAELGFYVGCLNLRTALATRGGRVCRPQPALPGSLVLNTRGLYEACLRLRTDKPVVGNDLAANGTSLVMITGANQGGKSTFLRALGLAHVMMAAGMFVAADVPAGVFTHFKREEDATMESGKLDEELARMSGIADAITANDLLLGNESFSATNEREGSEIARQILRALQETGVRVLFVTHLYDLAHTWYQQHPDTALFLRAEREEGGRRTFQLKPEEPLETSYGQDLYRQVFGSPDTDR
jgi:DNA mismatch repair ATPase MutS